MVRRLAVLLLILAAATAGRPRAPHPAAKLPPEFALPPILMYHRVDPVRPSDPVGRDLTISPAAFDAQLAYLKRRGIAAISVAQLRDRLLAHEPLTGTVVLTFDDGYADQYRYALPLLRRYGAAATFYIVTENVDTPRHLTWRDLRAMRDDGEDIAAHGLQHDDLSLMSPLQQERQIENSIRVLQAKLHEPVESYGYPSGRFNRETLRIVRRAGVALAVTTDPAYVIPPQSRFEIVRIRVSSAWTAVDFADALRSAMARTQVVSR